MYGRNGKWRTGLCAAVLLVTATLLATSVPVPTTPPESSGIRTETVGGSPRVLSSVGFSALNTSPTVSPAFVSHPGDTVIVFAQLFGTAQVSSVSDSSSDGFHRLIRSFQSYVTPYGSTIEQGFETWVALNASGGSAVAVTVTTSGPARQSDAFGVVDVTGVPPSSVDGLGIPTNSTAAGGQTREATTSVFANASDLVLTAVAARNFDCWTPVSPATTLEEVVTPTPGYYNTLAALETAPTQNGTVWTNATSNVSAPWIAGSIAIRPGVPYRAYDVGFSATGLPLATNWTVDVDGSTRTGPSTSNLSYWLPNGTYPFLVAAVGPYVPAPASGNVTVTGGTAVVTIAFSAPSWTVGFNESGLPLNMKWSVTLGGSSLSAYAPKPVDFSEVNGTYAFAVAAVTGYVPVPRTGTATVSGGATDINVSFVKGVQVSFTEKGLSPGETWSVTLGPLTESAASGKPVDFEVAKGTYSYTVGAVPGFTAGPASGNVSVGAKNVNVAITFTKIIRDYSIEFVDHGLYTGANWSVTLKSVEKWSVTGTPIAFVEPNGSYSFTLSVPSGFTIARTSGSVNVQGANVSVPVDYTAMISHVVLVMLENQEVTHLWAGAPYERYLAATFGNATNFYATCHSSTSQYLAVTSGRTFGCQSVSTDPGFSVTHLGDLLDANGLSWMAYQESMPYPCDTTSNGTYLDYHEPFFFYQDVLGNKSRCAAHIVNSAEFNESVQNGTLPAFSLYTPNYVDDGHGPTNAPWNQSTGLPFIEAWLKTFLPPILNHTGKYSSPAEQALVSHTAFILLYDEGVSNRGYNVSGLTTPGCFNQTWRNETTCGGRTQVTVISPFSLHRTYTPYATTYNVESTIEWLFGLPSDGGWDGSPSFPPMWSLFSFGAPNTTVAGTTIAPPAVPSVAPHSSGGPVNLRVLSDPADISFALVVAVAAFVRFAPYGRRREESGKVGGAAPPEPVRPA